ncbi:unnamed protein product [Cuscuta campestris]|uniref:Uncharacterized protein n=1 Tax=Cuscuta campestris TaxID=132261 RepID=A0A484NJT7_9ASTE|nr:unnamed protein product [Cuscuta campestris]
MQEITTLVGGLRLLRVHGPAAACVQVLLQPLLPTTSLGTRDLFLLFFPGVSRDSTRGPDKSSLRHQFPCLSLTQFQSPAYTSSFSHSVRRLVVRDTT